MQAEAEKKKNEAKVGEDTATVDDLVSYVEMVQSEGVEREKRTKAQFEKL